MRLVKKKKKRKKNYPYNLPNASQCLYWCFNFYACEASNECCALLSSLAGQLTVFSPNRKTAEDILGQNWKYIEN